MQFLDFLDGNQSKTKVLKAVAYIDKSPTKFRKFVQEFMGADGRDSQKLAWIIGKIVDTQPQLITPYVGEFVKKIDKPCHAAIKRNILRAIDKSVVPKAELGNVANLAFRLLESINETIAVRVFAMSILHKACLLEPDLSHELLTILEYQIPHETPGFRARAMKIIKSLSE